MREGDTFILWNPNIMQNMKGSGSSWKHLITVRLKYWEHQKLTSFSSKLDMSISDTCRMLISSRMNQINQATVDDAKDPARPERPIFDQNLCLMCSLILPQGGIR